MKQETERRSFYRINDVVGLSYQVLEESDGSASPRSNRPDLPLFDVLARIDHDFNQAANILWQENETAAHALGLLNRKLALLTAHYLREDEQEVEPHELLIVNISGSGIGFECDDPLPEDARLALSLVLKPSNIQLELTGDVTACEFRSARDKPYWIRVNFNDQQDSAREQLIQHVVQRQCAQLAEKNQSPADGKD